VTPPDPGLANARLRFVLQRNGRHINCDDLEAKHRAIKSRGIDRVAIADILRQGFVTPPYTATRNVMLVASGFERDASGEDHFVYRNPHTPAPIVSPRRDDAHYLARYDALLREAMATAVEGARQPALLQSGGKDSTSLAIALAATRPGTTCITYVAGTEEDESASAGAVAFRLGLAHRVLVSNPGRAWDSYVDVVARMPHLCADFALLSYVDLAQHLSASGFDRMLDGVGSDGYFGAVPTLKTRALLALARGWQLPLALTRAFPVNRSFPLCYLLSSVAMSPLQRVFPGSRFSDAETDLLLGAPLARLSRDRQAGLECYMRSQAIEQAVAFAKLQASAQGVMSKGLCTADAMGMTVAYPFTDERLAHFVHHHVPAELRANVSCGENKVLVRQHIEAKLGTLPYVRRKGSFRFNLRLLAAQRFEQVLEACTDVQDQLPGASAWLRSHHRLLDNKYFASKFYLLAIVAPWLRAHR
jgi:asparagine synthase (glutamine-hydrolysing)